MDAISLEFNIVIGVVIASVVQSIFGVGVLLFGTPILMLHGYEFSDILTTLLPISIAISFSQILGGYRNIDIQFLGKVLIYAIPFIVLCLVIAIKVERNMGFLVATLLYLFAAKNFFSSMSRILEWLASFERIWLITTGAIHGLTNLGGSLLTIAIHQKRYSKEVARATIAAAYITFAVVQLLTLIISKNIGLLSINNAKYLLIGMSIYLITNKMIYHRLNNQSYTKAFSAFLFCSGVLLTIKSL